MTCTLNSRTGLELSFLQLDAGLVRYRSLSALGEVVLRAPGDVVVLPEMFATGFRTDAGAVSQPMEGEIVTSMRSWAAKSGKAVAGSVAVLTDSGFRNRLIFAHPSGEVSYYDKRHLFRPGGEAEEFSRGAQRTVIEYRGGRFLPLLCYDLRFPVWSRCRGDFDVILCCAAWT